MAKRNIKQAREIKRCPFCGGDPALIINEYSKVEKFYHIECKCGAMMTLNGALFDDKIKAIKAWNRRK